MSDIHDLFDLAVKAVLRAGKIQKQGFGRKIHVQFKGPRDLVTEVDHRCEKTIFDLIKKAYPDHNILSEEGSGHKSSSPFRWIIDPLDGTTNYAHGYPCFCTSIALAKEDEVILGVAYDPLMDELYSAIKGEGAKLNDHPIHVSDTKYLGHALLATGRLTRNLKLVQTQFEKFQKLALNSHATRRDGSAVLDQCYVAIGRFDGFWELGLRPWDTAAGSLIVQEAGGQVTTFSGEPFNPFGFEILATNGILHTPMMDLLNTT